MKTEGYQKETDYKQIIESIIYDTSLFPIGDYRIIESKNSICLNRISNNLNLYHLQNNKLSENQLYYEMFKIIVINAIAYQNQTRVK